MQCSQEHLLTSFSDDVTTRYSEQAQHLVSLGLTKQSSFFYPADWYWHRNGIGAECANQQGCCHRVHQIASDAKAGKCRSQLCGVMCKS